MISVNAPHFCAGLELRENKVVNAAPILKYMMGWNEEKVISYCKKKDWNVCRTFRDHLKWASKEVETWPEWKQKAL